jgi:hypothetical protein
MKNFYRGWHIYYQPSAPVTGRYSAEQHGVSMCANDVNMLYKMIDAKIYDREQQLKKIDK